MDHERGHVRHLSAFIKGVLPEEWRSNLSGVWVRVIIRPPPFEFLHGEVKDPEPSPGLLVLSAEPDLPGDLWREWQAPDFVEIVRPMGVPESPKIFPSYIIPHH
jgi:hypothetical protein